MFSFNSHCKNRFQTPAAVEHFKPTFTRVNVCACKCACVEYNTRRNGANGSTGGKRERDWEKRGPGGQLPEHNYCSNNFHPSPASSLSDDLIPTSGTGFPARSARRSVIPKRPLPAMSGNQKQRSKQPSLFRVSSSSFIAPASLQPRPPRVGGELALTPPLPRASGEVNKSPGTPR